MHFTSLTLLGLRNQVETAHNTLKMDNETFVWTTAILRKNSGASRNNMGPTGVRLT
jgi:hypothetical protein